MSRGQTLRALVNERLAAAAEDIFVVFERTIKEFEEELCRSKEENQRKHQLPDKGQRTELIRWNVHIPSTSPGPGLNQEIIETVQIKEEPEEQSLKQEEEQLPVPVPESSAVCVKTEESSLLQQRQSEHRDKISSEPEGHTEHFSDTDNNNHWEPFSCTASQMETEVDGHHYNQVQISDRSAKVSPQNKSAPETTVLSGHMSGAEWKKQQCPFCNKIFGTKQHLEIHLSIHAGEKPYRCSICKQTFSQKAYLHKHNIIHTGEKPFNCSFCNKTFARKSILDLHARTHTGEKPYSCLACDKTFAYKCDLNKHTRIHTGEKPYSCSACNKTFAQKSSLDLHTRTHTGEKPYSCLICAKTFAQKSTLDLHVRTHTGERPYSCLICKKTFTRKSHLDLHTRTHTGEKPYSCSICDKTFAQKSHLNSHMSTHSVKSFTLFC